MTLLETGLMLGCLSSVIIFYACLWTDRPFGIPVGAAVLCFLLLFISVISSSQPVNLTPKPPFILYAAAGPYAWVGPVDQESPPRTYLWEVPNELQEQLQEGALLVEEGKPGEEEVGAEGDFPYGEWEVSPFEQERMRKSE